MNRSSSGRRNVPAEFRTLERGHRGGWGFPVFLFFLFITSIVGFFYWTSRPQFQGDSVQFSAAGPDRIVSGDDVVYVIEYENQDVVALPEVELDVQWPDGFYFNASSDAPKSEAATTWVLGPLDPGQKKTLEISGQLVGEKDQTQAAFFRLSYRPENISSDFEIEKTVRILITDAKVSLELAATEKIIAGKETVLIAKITNTTAETLFNLDVEVSAPKDFDLISAEPTLTGGHWKGDLEAGSPLELTIKARAVETATGLQQWVVDVNHVANEKTRRLLRKEFPVQVVQPDFSIDLKVNGQSGDIAIEYGQTLNYQLKIVNVGSSPVTDVEVTALMDSDILDRKSLQSTGVADARSVSWTKENQPDLADMGSGKEVIIDWKINVLSQGSAGRAAVDTLITLEIQGLPDWQQNSPVYVMTVGVGLVFNQGLYWHLGGQKVGKGNLPPVTNESTQYLVIWSIDSGNRDFDTVNVSAFLPPKVTFVDEEEIDEGRLNYDAETNRLEWQIDTFSSKLLPLKATFYLKLVPVDEDKGTVMTVVNPTTIVASGKDVFQSKSFALTTQQVITTQEGDVGTIVE